MSTVAKILIPDWGIYSVIDFIPQSVTKNLAETKNLATALKP